MSTRFNLIRNSLLRNSFPASFKRSTTTECPKCKPDDGHQGGYKFWKKLALMGGVPIIIFLTVNMIIFKMAMPEERPPFVKYEYLRRRTKRFPWGDGTKSLFHNPHMNALPDGYEPEEVEETEEPEEPQE